MRVLCYHAVTTDDDPVWGPFAVTPAALADHLQVLARAGARFVDGPDALEVLTGRRRADPRSVLVTFDDGYADFARTALPILRRAGVPSVLFAVSALRENRWDVEGGASPRRLLGLDELADLSRQDDVDIGVHTRTHPDLRTLSPREVQDQVAGAHDDLRAAGVEALPLLAYPFGGHDADVRAAVADAGYAAAFTIEPGIASPAADPYALPRMMVMRDWGTVGLLARVALAGRGPRR
jgi:peptidoglycan/xylan/chitin deacetylase (PgdA/CDA1 family)